MNITHVVYDINTFGITLRSLKMLRDALAEKIYHRIVVAEVPTNDQCCGYFIFDWEWKNATWTGDGFRKDRRGEGGAGYRTAEMLLKIFGLWTINWDIVNIDKIYALPEEQIEKELKRAAQEIVDNIPDRDFNRPSEKKPEYAR
jgi:hypothetical protein